MTERPFSSIPQLVRKTACLGSLALWLVACSPERDSAPEVIKAKKSATSAIAPSPALPSEAPLTGKANDAAASNVLTLEGLETLKIGEPIPPGANWSERGAQTPGPCRIVSSPNFLGVYAIVEQGKVRRITVGGQSNVKLIEGIGIGAKEAEVLKAFSGFVEQPHKYVASPAKYLTTPGLPVGSPGLRFEINIDRTVSLMHVGTMPVLSYVEGCS